MAKRKTKTASKPINTSEKLVEVVVHGIEEVKGEEIVVMDLRGVANAVADFFVICQAESTTQVNAIAGAVEVEVKKATGERAWHIEGFQNAEWILMDYVNVVVHIFQPEMRRFYSIEKLWADAEFKYIQPGK